MVSGTGTVKVRRAYRATDSEACRDRDGSLQGVGIPDAGSQYCLKGVAIVDGNAL